MNISRNIWHPIALGILAALVGLAAITKQSLWMDEGSTAFKALMPTFKDWTAMTYRLGGSDIQMPFYMIAVWAWVKTGLVSEYALRCINLPFLILMVLALRRIRFWPLVCLTSPFVLYYAGELRPYSLQMAAGAVVAAGIGRIIRNNASATFDGLHTVAAGSMLLVLGSLTSAVWAGGCVLAVVILRPDWLKRKDFWKRVAPWCAVALLVLGYYVHTLLEGYRATTSGGGGLLSMGFGFYEMVGLMGIGPSRDELRASISTLYPHLPWLVPCSLILAISWLVGFREWIAHTKTRNIAAVAAAVLVPLAIFASVSLAADFRVLGRHLSPAIPVMLLPLALCWERGIKDSKPALGLAVLSSLIFLASAASLRFGKQHSRDDYRTASAIAIKGLGQGKRILWQADMNATRYYAYRAGGMAYIQPLQELEADPPGLLFADIVIVNRPDIRFKGIDYSKELKKADFELQSEFTGFQVWIPSSR